MKNRRSFDQKERFRAVQMELFALAEEQKQLRLKLTALRLLVRSLGVALLKKCAKCKIEMEAAQFYRDQRYRDGLYPYCRECKSAKGKQWYHSRKKAA